MNTRSLHLAVLAALAVGRIHGQAPAAPATAGAPLIPSAVVPAVPAASAQTAPASPAPSASGIPAFPDPPSRLRRATNAPAGITQSTNQPSALPRAFPRPVAPPPPAPPALPGATKAGSATAGKSAAGGAGAGGAAAKPGQPSEEDQAINDATLKALRESRGTNQPSDSIVFKDQDLNVFLDQVYGPLVKRTVLRAQGLPQV